MKAVAVGLLTVLAGSISAETLTLGVPGQTIPGLTVTYDRGSNATNFFYLGSLVIEADDGVSFDVLSADIIFMESLMLGVHVDDIPAGVDPSTPDGYGVLWQESLWESVPSLDLLYTIRGYSDGALVAEWSEPVISTIPYTQSIGYVPPPRDDDADPRSLEGLPMRGLDRVEITYADEVLQTHNQNVALLLDDYWVYSDLRTLAFDDLVLDVTYPVSVPDPDPVPLPLGGALLLGALGLMAMRSEK